VNDAQTLYSFDSVEFLLLRVSDIANYFMSDTWEAILNLVQRGEIMVSEHGYEEIAADDIRVRDIVSGVPNAEVVEDYPGYRKGPCVLVL